jgi:hypothetical protein
MRKALAKQNGVRATFHGTFERFGTKNGWAGPERTLLLRNVCDEGGTRVCDHLWFNLTKAFEALALQPGDPVQFDARVKAYTKGYFGRREDVYKPAETDYKLSHPTRVAKLHG